MNLSRTTSAYRVVSAAAIQMSRLDRPALFICDIQERFQSAIHHYPHVINTTKKMLSASRTLQIPIFATTQLRDKLGCTDPDLKLDQPNGYQTLAHVDKSLFSMWTPEIQTAVAGHYGPKPIQVAIVGIESHICVTQTALDLLNAGHRVFVLADGVSSCNPQEIPLALARLRQEGATVTTSESFLYQVMGSANIPQFKEIANLVKQTKAETKNALSELT